MFEIYTFIYCTHSFVGCSADFPNCRTCGDKDGDGVIGAGECSTCQSGYVRKDDEESCAGNFYKYILLNISDALFMGS